jgi:hypothetical protein
MVKMSFKNFWYLKFKPLEIRYKSNLIPCANGNVVL